MGQYFSKDITRIEKMLPQGCAIPWIGPEILNNVYYNYKISAGLRRMLSIGDNIR